MKPTLLCYNLTGERGRKIRFAAMGLSIKLRSVEENEYHQPLSVLCGLEEAGEPIPPEGMFSEEMLVMAGFPNGLVSLFLQAFKKMKLQPVLLKAILTETNKDWNSVQLHEELQAERAAVLQGITAEHSEADSQ